MDVDVDVVHSMGDISSDTSKVRWSGYTTAGRLDDWGATLAASMAALWAAVRVVWRVSPLGAHLELTRAVQ